jgi:hypothetical protein
VVTWKVDKAVVNTWVSMLPFAECSSLMIALAGALAEVLLDAFGGDEGR